MHNEKKINYSIFPIPLKRRINEKCEIIRNFSDLSINKNRTVDNDKYKDISLLKKQLLNQTNISRNINKILSNFKFKSIAKSDIFQKFSKSLYNFGPFNKSNILNNSKGTFNRAGNSDISNNNNTSKSIYSAYEINSALNTKKNFICDMLTHQRDEENNKTQRVSDIQRKIKKLEKTLNLSEYTTRTSTFFKIKKKVKTAKENDKKNNSATFSLTKRSEFKERKKNSFLFFKKIRDKFMLEKLDRYLKNDESYESENNKKCIIDNKLNIIYSENQNIFRRKLIAINKRLKAKGQIQKLKRFYSPSELQLKNMERKVNFMKDIFEYAFPNSEIAKLTEKGKKFKYIKYKDAVNQPESYK